MSLTSSLQKVSLFNISLHKLANMISTIKLQTTFLKKIGCFQKMPLQLSQCESYILFLGNEIFPQSADNISELHNWDIGHVGAYFLLRHPISKYQLEYFQGRIYSFYQGGSVLHLRA